MCIPIDMAAWPTGKAMGFALGFAFVLLQRAHEDWVTGKQYCTFAPSAANGQCSHGAQGWVWYLKKLLVFVRHLHTQILTSVSTVSMGRTAIDLMVRSQSQWLPGPFAEAGGIGEESDVPMLRERCPKDGYSLLCNVGLLCQNSTQLSEREKQKCLLGVYEESRLPTMYQAHPDCHESITHLPVFQ